MAPERENRVLDGRYAIADLLGAGGMGEVYRAHDRRLGREVAIKVLLPELSRQPDVRARFDHEARAAARISHPAAVTVFDSGDADGTPYLVMECLPGRTLADELRAGPLPSARVREIAIDLLGALGAAHELGIIHRDVKPGNILLTADGRVKLADFGIAKSTEGLDQTSTGQLIGTAAYLAPERLAGGPATPATDLYSLGVVLFEALTGIKPFDGNTPVAIAHSISSAPTPRPSETRDDIAPDLDAVVVGALTRSPVERYQSAAAMRASLEGATPIPPRYEPTGGAGEPTRTESIVTSSEPATALLEEATVLGPALEVGTSAGGRSRRRRSLARVVVALACIALAVLIGSLVLWGRDDSVSPGTPVTTTTAVTVTSTTSPSPTTPTTAPKPGGGKGQDKKGNPKAD